MLFNKDEFERRASDVRAEFHKSIADKTGCCRVSSINLDSRAARQRLLRDYKEVLSCPTPGVSAAPLEDNIFQWHVNLCPSSGPYAGITLHCVLLFDNSYPTKPPKLKLGTPLQHP